MWQASTRKAPRATGYGQGPGDPWRNVIRADKEPLRSYRRLGRSLQSSSILDWNRYVDREADLARATSPAENRISCSFRRAMSADCLVACLGAGDPSPAGRGLQDLVHSPVARPAQRNKVVGALVAETVVAAVMEIAVAKCPGRPTDSTARFDSMERDEGLTPAPSLLQPRPASHPGLVPLPIKHPATRPVKGGPRVTHRCSIGARRVAELPGVCRHRSRKSTARASS